MGNLRLLKIMKYVNQIVWLADRIACSKFCLLRIPLLHLIFMYSGYVRLVVTGAHLLRCAFKKPPTKTETGKYVLA